MILEETLEKIKKPSQEAMERCRQHWDSIAKPLHSLGKLEDALVRIAGMTGNERIHLDKKALVVMCADNGVVEEGVTQSGQEVFIDVDYKTRESIKPMVMELEDMGVIVNLKLEILDSYKDFDSKLGYIGAVPVITFANRIYDWKGMLVKRCIDILGAIVGLIVMFIAMIFVSPTARRIAAP